jgi:hypothetical protein
MIEAQQVAVAQAEGDEDAVAAEADREIRTLAWSELIAPPGLRSSAVKLPVADPPSE